MTKFIGFQHRVGNRKADGKPYDFYELHFTTDLNTYITGKEAFKDTMSADMLKMDDKQLALKLDMECQLLYSRIGENTRLSGIVFV